ncbi:4-hydroxy-tetrahydrodipicolinate reductase [Pirellulaceae bacterium]|jgi:4-hydroxy-tetrahydrodipicolinate reductase|nr:4-hydroxy-tetrahydrodipicolinate reductase [Pirellulaceae bacterium]
MKNIAINGANGRMGRRLVALGHADERMNLAAALEYTGCEALGTDSGTAAGIGEIGVPFTDDYKPDFDAVIDFSTPAGCESAVKQCVEKSIPLVVATTGLTESQIQLVEDATKSIPIVWAPNMSMAVNLTMKLVEAAATSLKNVATGVDVEILERHHRYKEDSPSGTALKFGAIVKEAMGQTSEAHGREGMVGTRPASELGYHAIRVGDNPGEHTIIFGMLGETIELRVAASNRDCYALGAIEAAIWLAGKPAGKYNMYDVLGL